MSKATAIALVNQFASQAAPVAWPQINRAALAAGLIERINDPNRISQRGTPFCGPASLLRAVATDNPDAYAQAAIDLYTRGSASIRNLRLNPGGELRQSAPRGSTNPADWMMLAGLRDSSNWFFSPAGWFGLNLAGITTPGNMEAWFRDAGYTEIVNVTYLVAKPISMALAVEAQRASQLFSRGYKVVLLIDSDMLDQDCQDDLVSMYPDHWIALASPIRDGGVVNYDAPVSFRAFSWGRELSVPVNAARPLSKRQFLHKYYGFIAARS